MRRRVVAGERLVDVVALTEHLEACAARRVQMSGGRVMRDGVAHGRLIGLRSDRPVVMPTWQLRRFAPSIPAGVHGWWLVRPDGGLERADERAVREGAR